MPEAASSLPRPGLLGLLIRLVLGVLVTWWGLGAIQDVSRFFDGYSDPTGAIPSIVLLAFLTPGVINELLQRSWGWRPSGVALIGLAAVAAIGAWQGDLFGPAFGVYVWVWLVATSLLLGPAFLLAAALRTPGCEMRSFADLWTRLHGGDRDEVPCAGWIDRFDGVRLFGRF